MRGEKRLRTYPLIFCSDMARCALFNELAQCLFDLAMFVFIDHFGSIWPGDVEGVHGGAFFCADTGVDGGESELVDG